MENPIPYYPGADGADAVRRMIDQMMAPETNRHCIKCDEVNKYPGLVGIVNYTGDAAALMGARPGKERVAVYYVCADCAATYPDADTMSADCDSRLLAQIVALNGEVPG